MTQNVELKEIRAKKREIYKGLRLLLARGRKIGCEFGRLDLSNFSDKDLEYINSLWQYIWGIPLDSKFYKVVSTSTFTTLIDKLLEKGFSDDVCQLDYTVEKSGYCTIYVLIFKDKYKNKHDRVDIYVINNNDESK